jgi:hypothetical protein
MYRLSSNKNYAQEMQLIKDKYFSGKQKLHKQKTYFQSLKGQVNRVPYQHRHESYFDVSRESSKSKERERMVPITLISSEQ